MTFETLNNLLYYASSNNITEKEACILLNEKYKTIFYYKKKYGVNIENRGKNINSIKKRKYSVDDDFFSVKNKLNSYWAGFIAADGNINQKKDTLTIGLSIKDRCHLESFLNNVKSNNPIHMYLAQEKYEQCSINITSAKICYDLENNFNIIPNKSLIIKHPNIKDNEFVDSFIIGYIDGDGCIYKKRSSIGISIMGTFSMLNFIKNRFEEIIGKEVKCIRHDNKHNDSTFILEIGDKNARILFKHFYNVICPKLERKWSEKIKVLCDNFKKKRDVSRYKEVYQQSLLGYNQTEIAKKLDCSQAAISWIQKQELYKKIKRKTSNVKVIL